jgi:translocation protein SEC63
MALGLLFAPCPGFYFWLIWTQIQNHKPNWWIVLADAKSDRLVVPPQKISDVPFSDPTCVRNYRSYKLKFQAPPGTGLFTWRLIVVSDTYIGEDAAKDLQVYCFS